METYGTRLRRWREAKGLSQEEAARVFDVTIRTYQNWEGDVVEPRGRDLSHRSRVDRKLETFERNVPAREKGE